MPPKVFYLCILVAIFCVFLFTENCADLISDYTKKQDLKIVEYIRKKSTVRVMAIKEISQERKDLMEGLVNSGKRFNTLTKNANSGIHRPQELYREMNELRKILLALEKEVL